MELREWQYINKPAGNSSGYKKRFEKLIKYHIDHASSELESITHKDIKEDSFRLSEHYNNGHHEFDRDIIASYDKASDTFMLRIFIDGKEVDNILRKGYEDFVDAAEDYMFLPDYNTPEYDDLLVESVSSELKEWKLMNPPKAAQPAASSKTNKEKFTVLLDYMKTHKSSLVTKADTVRLDDGGFTYKEHWHSPSGQDYVLTLLVGYSRFSPAWRYELYMDTSLIKEAQGLGWEDLIEELEKYFHVPKVGTNEYDSLVEWIAMSRKQVSNSSATTSSTKNYPDQTDRYKRLLAQIDSDKTCSYTVNLLDDRILAITINSKKGDLGFKLIFKPYVPCYLLQLTSKEGIKEISREDFDEVLDVLLDAGLINNTDLCESTGSIADDFKLYENLWN